MVEVVDYRSLTPALEKGYYVLHTYSKAPEASAKRMIDLQIMENDFAKGHRINMQSEEYLKELIKRASGGRFKAIGGSSGLEFFIIRGGGEGFLDPRYRDKNASRDIRFYGSTTAGEVGSTFVFDCNDLIVAFDKRGKLISSALLERPISIALRNDPNFWTESTANQVYDAWDGQWVSLYQNTYFFLKYNGVKYYGLWVSDSKNFYATGKVRIDIHKQEQTNGCIFIVDPATPSLANKAALDDFEPLFITSIQSEIKAKVRQNIGKMHIVTIK
ncbi:MAG: hypothetical protein AB7H90_08780 [Alphaproteobacteria bacterium]